MLAVRRADRGDNVEQRILWAMLSNVRVLSVVAARWAPRLFGNPEARRVGAWAVEFWAQFGRPPGREVLSKLDAWAATNPPKEELDLTGLLLQQTFDRWEDSGYPLNADVILEEARRFFKQNALVDLADYIRAAVEAGDVDKAAGYAAAYREIDLGMGSDTTLLGDDPLWDAMAETARAPLIEFPHHLAITNFFKGMLCAESFVSFLGMEKIGKSWFLQWLAWEAMLQGRNVYYVEAGDSSDAQVRERFAPRVLGRPLEKGRYLLPTNLDTDGRQFRLQTQVDIYADDYNPDLLRIARRKLDRRLGPERMRLLCRPSGTVSVKYLDSVLDEHRRNSWHAGVVVIDYADILAAENPRLDKRDQIDETWRALRSLSQKHHCLVITATQANKESYAGEWTLARRHITEDKRKLGHVNAMVGINQNASEKDNEIYRLNVVVGRRVTFPDSRCLWLAGNLHYSRIGLEATF